MEGIFLLCLFFLGLIFRLWFISLVPQPFVFDQVVYANIAASIQSHFLYVDRFRTYGYPLIMAVVGWISKSDIAWKIFQAGLDATVVILIYLIGKKIFADKKPAIISALIYLFNPYTSAYTGIFLSEVTTVFFLTLVFFLLALFLQKKKLISISLLSFTAGYLVQIRPEFIYFSIFVLGFALWIYWKSPYQVVKKIKITFLIICLFLSAFVYQIVGNIVQYHQFSLLTVDNAFVTSFYISTQIKRRLTSDTDDMEQYPSSVNRIFREYSTPDTPSGRKQMAKKYWNLAISEIEKNPGQFLRSRIEKFWYVWEKHNLFLYKIEPVSPLVEKLIYWVNVLLLFTGIIGLVQWRRSVKKDILVKYQYFHLLTIIFLIYITVIYSFSTAYERYSISAYPLVILFAGYAVYFGQRFVRKKHKNGG